MTVHELSRLYWLDRLIRREEERLEDLQCALDLKSPGYSDMPKAPGVRDKIGELVPEIEDLRATIERKKREYIAEKKKLTDYIEAIDDPQVKLIVLYRFVDLMTWQQVADEIGGRATEVSVKKVCYRYLNSGG